MRVALYRIESIWRNQVTLRDLQTNRPPFQLREGDEFAIHLAEYGPRTMTSGDILGQANEVVHQNKERR
jgi:hypothetical protein